ncbi:hypothetical protein RB2150_04738 [Rhodobacterales bacterium HTCC2150]|nr:hypothetical protein RB2150_04738 [Rhodobacterales bacterium HTCC2150] [Rhodobacteraceae bacterium HTCC2150]
MMRKLLLTTCLLAFGQINFTGGAMAQSALPPKTADQFDPENAVIDTAIPFAIGARQARQSLRGAFGWDTFQEGLVEGVYFRFDPDGYARFSTSPRLDTDVFEVICRPRTLLCIARKDALTIVLDSRGRVQLKIDQLLEGDTFFVSEGVSELQLPERLFLPLDSRLETLLMAGGELIIRRDSEDVHTISLNGFSAVVPYLRWVAAEQNYTILPRDWPVPSSNTPISENSSFNDSVWSSRLVPDDNETANLMGNTTLQNANAVGEGMEQLSSEIDALRQALLAQNKPNSVHDPMIDEGETLPLTSFHRGEAHALGKGVDSSLDYQVRLSKLEISMIQVLSDLKTIELAISENTAPKAIKPEVSNYNDEMAVNKANDAALANDEVEKIFEKLLAARNKTSEMDSEVSKRFEDEAKTLLGDSRAPISPVATDTITQLSSELGISKSSASLLLTLLESSVNGTEQKEIAGTGTEGNDTSTLLSDRMVMKILSDLENDAKTLPIKQVDVPSLVDEAEKPIVQAQISREFVTLSEYLRTVLHSAKP